MPGGGSKIEWKDGKGPLAFRVAVVAIISDFVLMFGALLWRDFFAPTEPKPGLVESLGRHARYYVPTWFRSAENAAAILFAILVFLILILRGYYHELLAPEEDEKNTHS